VSDSSGSGWLLKVLAGASLALPGSAQAGLGGKDVRVPLLWLDGDKAAELAPGDFGRHLRSGGVRRFYEMHVPKGWDESKPTPVVLVLHGGGSYPAAVRYESGMDAVADRGGFIAVYPGGTNDRLLMRDRLLLWNDGREKQDGSKMKVDDVAFIRDVLDDVERLCKVDPRRVYACGYSNGAQMSYVLAQKLSDRIAAIAAVAGQRPPDQLYAPPPRAVPVLQFAGKRDRIGPYDGGAPNFEAEFKTELPPVEKTVRAWAAHDGCPTEPKTRAVGKAKEMRFGPGRDGSEVVLWALEDGGHTWPGGNVLPAVAEQLGPINKDIHAASLMWEFFAAHPMPESAAGEAPRGGEARR
jgi:polyhydroxybutyrate depolymerase